MDKVKKVLLKAFLVAIIYNILVLIMMTDSMELQIVIYYLGLAIIGTWMYKVINLVITKIKRIKSKDEK